MPSVQISSGMSVVCPRRTFCRGWERAGESGRGSGEGRRGQKRRKKRNLPVAVSRICILNVSASMTVAPELGPLGDNRAVMAWIPCNVPARTRYSFEVSCARPSVRGLNL